VRICTALLLLFGLLACRAEPQSAAAQAPTPAVSPAGLALVPLSIRSGTREHRFTVEVARTEAEQARGLMFRTSLAPDRGMIFPFDPPRPASFWMKNTFIPLDMLFIRPDGSIARVAANTVPHSLDEVAVGEPVAAVLEIAGGRAAELAIVEGAQVSWGEAAPR
jgi:uncharacterized membrane protein (UPF0127 family)